MNQRTIVTLGVGILALSAGIAPAQSLMLRSLEDLRGDASLQRPGQSLSGVSMFFVQPPEPHEYKPHDLVTILIDETSRAESNQTLDTSTESDTGVTLNSFLDPVQLLELKLRQAGVSNLDLVEASADREFKGEGDYERTDRFTARITAEIIEIKPNGNILLQARRRIKSGNEEREIVLSGVARQQDITAQNTLLSSQIANLSLIQQHEGAVDRAARKGFLTRVLDAVFSF